MRKSALLSAAVLAAGVFGAQANTASLNLGNSTVSIEKLLLEGDSGVTLKPTNSYIIPVTVAKGNRIVIIANGAEIQNRTSVVMCNSANTKVAEAEETQPQSQSQVNLKVISNAGIGGTGERYYFASSDCFTDNTNSNNVQYKITKSAISSGDRVTLTVFAEDANGRIVGTEATANLAYLQRQFTGEIRKVTSQINVSGTNALKSFVEAGSTPPMTTQNETIAGFRIVNNKNNNFYSYISVDSSTNCEAKIDENNTSDNISFIFKLRGNFDIFSSLVLTNGSTEISNTGKSISSGQTQEFTFPGNTTIICSASDTNNVNGIKLKLKSSLNSNITPRNISAQIEMKIKDEQPLVIVSERTSHEIVFGEAGTYAYVPLVRYDATIRTFIKFISDDPSIGRADIRVEVLDRATGEFRAVPGISYNSSTKAEPGKEFTISAADIVEKAQAAGININPVQGFPVRIFIPATQSKIHIYANSVTTDGQFRRIPVKFDIGIINGDNRLIE